jgi:peptidoglycan hydrolase-like protein with peptidoglycan-binding domain
MNYPGRAIKKGEKDPSIVKAVQDRLNKMGFGPLEVDGNFGDLTVSAVKEFQSLTRDSNGNPLVIDGKLGPISWAALFRVIVGETDSSYSPPALFTKVLGIASSQVGVLEDPPGSNRGPRVEEYLRSVGCLPGDPWCASFVYWCFNKASESLGIMNPLVRTGSCMTHWSDTSGRKILHSKATNDPSLVKPGFIFIIDHGNWKGHTGIVRTTENGYIGTIEGNTNIDGSREGLGVAELRRKIITINAGFIDYSGSE